MSTSLEKIINFIWDFYKTLVLVFFTAYLFAFLIFGGEFSIHIHWDSFSKLIDTISKNHSNN